ncbi:MAG: nitrite reductase, copper-containing [Acetobacteraceae bacterium]|nr:nitrite reductase, copper-containing [Acetobacteraceae bacterium]
MTVRLYFIRNRGIAAFFTALVFILAPGLTVSSRAIGPSTTAKIQMQPNVTFVLRTGIANGKMVFIGKGGAIDGKVNPTLVVRENDVVQVTLINGEGAVHDISFPDFHVTSERVTSPGASSTIVFQVGSAGTYSYFCTVPGHREAGMEGLIRVELAPVKAEAGAAVDISRDPADLPPPVGDREPLTVRYDLEAVERVGRLADQTTYTFWTFNGKVPGPFLRVREGDTVVLHLSNAKDDVMFHSIDLHAVNGPGGGAVATQVAPGEEKSFVFKALVPGLYVYHCATPMVANHISNGMYGLILVEPPGGLPKVDREYYVMQGELYTTEGFGKTGAQQFSYEKLMDERPDYFVFNGAVDSLTNKHPLKANVGETVRIFFGVGGPNFTSSFHVIGQIFSRVYLNGSLSSPPQTGVQTVSVPPGDAVIVELTTRVPGKYLLVDHALSRLERGLVGALIVNGPPAPEIFHEGPARGE